MKNRKELPALLVLLGLAPAAVAQLSTFRVTDYPGAKFACAKEINCAGDIVGHSQAQGGSR